MIFSNVEEEMSRQAVRIRCEEGELLELRRVVSAKKSAQRDVMRANIILYCHEGLNNLEISKKLGVNYLTARYWRIRFSKERLKGLKDMRRSGKPKQYTDSDRMKILKLLEEKPPKGQSSWDGRSLSEALSFSRDYVWRVLRKEGIQLQRIRTWCVSTDPEFGSKSADIIGLYLSPPDRAFVLCVDEKPSIQALSRKIGYVETSSGKIVRGLKSTYKRNGTLNLFAALNVATGQVNIKTTATKKRPDFQDFLENVTQNIPLNQTVHIILDNYCTHKKNDDWLKAHPNIKFHFTPTSASWLNQVEIWFGILSRKVLNGASFDNKESLSQAIVNFTEAYHQNAKPFVWKKRDVKGSQLRNTIINLCN